MMFYFSMKDRAHCRRLLGWGSVVLALMVVPSFAQAESLEEAMAATYSSNPTLRAERAQLRATDEGMSQAISAWRPTITATGAIGESRTSSKTALNAVTGGTGTASQQRNLDPRSGEIRFEQTLLDGTDIYNVGAARADVLAAREVLTQVEQSVLLDAVTAYVDVLRDEAVVQLNNNNVQVLFRQLDASNARFEVGEITRTDVAQSEARLSGARTTMREAEAQLATSRAIYERVVGHMPGTLYPPQSLPALPDSLEAARSLALAHNPALNAARAVERASQKRIGAAAGELLPSVAVLGSIGYTEDTTFPGDSRQGEEYRLQVDVPLYQGGAGHSSVRQARELNSRDRIQIAETQRDVIESVTTAWENYQAARIRIISGEEQVRANSVALEGVRQELQVGSRTTLDVLDAEQEYLDAQVALAQSRRDEVVAAYSLIAAIGGLTAPKLGLPVRLYDPAKNYKRVRLKFFGVGAGDE